TRCRLNNLPPLDCGGRGPGQGAGRTAPMLEHEEQYAIAAIRTALAEMGYPTEKVPVRSINLAGRWGVASTVAMQLSKGNRDLAAKIAAGVAERLRALNHFADVYVENNYINCIFDAGKVATDVVRNALSQGDDYGRGEAAPG